VRAFDKLLVDSEGGVNVCFFAEEAATPLVFDFAERGEIAGLDGLLKLALGRTSSADDVSAKSASSRVIDEVLQLGYPAWLAAQRNQPISKTRPYLDFVRADVLQNNLPAAQLPYHRAAHPTRVQATNFTTPWKRTLFFRTDHRPPAAGVGKGCLPAAGGAFVQAGPGGGLND